MEDTSLLSCPLPGSSDAQTTLGFASSNLQCAVGQSKAPVRSIAGTGQRDRGRVPGSCHATALPAAAIEIVPRKGSPALCMEPVMSANSGSSIPDFKAATDSYLIHMEAELTDVAIQRAPCFLQVWYHLQQLAVERAWIVQHDKCFLYTCWLYTM